VTAKQIVLTLALACVPSIAAADSDGHFCSTPGILAFDAFIPGAPGRIIKIVRFDALGGIKPAEEVRITDDFQTHAMYCKPNSIEVHSWDHVYVIDTSVPLAPKLADKRASAIAREPASVALQHNLAADRPGLTVLQSVGDDERFELVVTRTQSVEPGNGVITYTSTHLVHRAGREIRAHQPLFFGVHREIGE